MGFLSEKLNKSTEAIERDLSCIFRARDALFDVTACGNQENSEKTGDNKVKDKICQYGRFWWDTAIIDEWLATCEDMYQSYSTSLKKCMSSPGKRKYGKTKTAIKPQLAQQKFLTLEDYCPEYRTN